VTQVTFQALGAPAGPQLPEERALTVMMLLRQLGGNVTYSERTSTATLDPRSAVGPLIEIANDGRLDGFCRYWAYRAKEQPALAKHPLKLEDCLLVGSYLLRSCPSPGRS